MSEADFLLSASQTMPYEKWRLHVQKKTVQIAKTGSAHQQASLEPLDRNRSDDHHKSRAHKTEHFGETQTDESKKNVESPRSALRLALAARQEIDSDSDSGDSLSYAPLPNKKPIRARTDSNDSSSVSVSWNKNLASVAKPKISSVASKKGVAKRLVKPATRHHRSASQEEAVLYRSSIGTGAGVNSLGSVPARTVSSARARRAKAPILPAKSMSGSALKEVAFGRSIAKAPGASQTRRKKRAVSTASTPLYNSDSDSSNGSSHGSSHNDSAILIAARLRRGGSHDRDSEQPTRGRVAVRRDSVTFLQQKRDGVPPLVDLDDDGHSPPAPPPPRARRSSLDQPPKRIVGGQVVQTTPLKPRKTSKRRDDRTHMRPTQSSRSRAKSVKAKRKHHRPWRPSSAHPNRHSMPFGWGQTVGPARSHSAAPSRHRSAVASGSRRGERSEDAESKPRMAALANKLTLEFARMFIRANGYLPHYKLYKRWLNQNEVASYSRLGEAAYNGLTLPLQVLQRRELFVQQQSKRGLLTNSTPSEPGPRTGTLAAGRAGLVNGSQDLVVESAPIETIYKEPRTPSVSFRASAEVMQRPRRPNARSRTVKLTTNSLLDAKAAEAIISSAMKQTPVQLGRVGTFMRSPAPRRFEDESVVRSPGNSRRTSYDEETLDLDGEGDEAAAT